MADFTKAEGLLQSLEWETITADSGLASWESNELSLPDEIGALLHICLAHLDVNAVAAGSEPIVIVWIKSGTGDDDWHELIRFTGTGGTANSQVLDQESAAAQALVKLTSTTNFETAGDVYFLNDNSHVENSELVCLKSYSDNDYFTAIDNLSHTFAIADDVFDIVDQWPVRIPKEVKAAKVTVHLNDADADFAVRVRYSTDTDIE